MFAWSCWCGCTQGFWSMLCLHGAAGVAALRVSGVCYVCMELLAGLHSEFLEYVMFAWSCWCGCTQSFWSIMFASSCWCDCTQSFWSMLCLHGAAGVAALRVSGVCYVCMELLVWLHSEFLEYVMFAWCCWYGCTQSFWTMLCLHGAAGVAALEFLECVMFAWSCWRGCTRVSGVCYVCMELLAWLHSKFLEYVMFAWSCWCGCTQSFWSMLCLQ